MNEQINNGIVIDDLVNNIVNAMDKRNILAIGLTGSYARGEAGPYSDIDIICFLDNTCPGRPTSIHMIDGKYTVVSYITQQDAEECFIEPDIATASINGLRTTKIIWDPDGYLFQLKDRAASFEWNDSLQRKANKYASKELVGWAEEVHKALEGLKSNDTGRILNGLFGLTHGLFNVIRVQKGILLKGENFFFDQVVDHYGVDSKFAQLACNAFGIGEPISINDRAIAGLLLYQEITDELMEILEEEDRKIISFVKNELKDAMMHR